jgi:ApbE family protein
MDTVTAYRRRLRPQASSGLSWAVVGAGNNGLKKSAPQCASRSSCADGDRPPPGHAQQRCVGNVAQLRGGVGLVGRGVVGSQPRRQAVSRGGTHPFRNDTFCAAVALRDGAVATSGLYARGLHVVDPRQRRPATDLAAATVIGPDLAMADAYATTALAMGPSAGLARRPVRSRGSDHRPHWAVVGDRGFRVLPGSRRSFSCLTGRQ